MPIPKEFESIYGTKNTTVKKSDNTGYVKYSPVDQEYIFNYDSHRSLFDRSMDPIYGQVIHKMNSDPSYDPYSIGEVISHAGEGKGLAAKATLKTLGFVMTNFIEFEASPVGIALNVASPLARVTGLAGKGLTAESSSRALKGLFGEKMAQGVAKNAMLDGLDKTMGDKIGNVTKDMIGKSMTENISQETVVANSKIGVMRSPSGEIKPVTPGIQKMAETLNTLKETKNFMVEAIADRLAKSKGLVAYTEKELTGAEQIFRIENEQHVKSIKGLEGRLKAYKGFTPETLVEANPVHQFHADAITLQEAMPDPFKVNPKKVGLSLIPHSPAKRLQGYGIVETLENIQRNRQLENIAIDKAAYEGEAPLLPFRNNSKKAIDFTRVYSGEKKLSESVLSKVEYEKGVAFWEKHMDTMADRLGIPLEARKENYIPQLFEKAPGVLRTQREAENFLGLKEAFMFHERKGLVPKDQRMLNIVDIFNKYNKVAIDVMHSEPYKGVLNAQLSRIQQYDKSTHEYAKWLVSSFYGAPSAIDRKMKVAIEGFAKHLPAKMVDSIAKAGWDLRNVSQYIVSNLSKTIANFGAQGMLWGNIPSSIRHGSKVLTITGPEIGFTWAWKGFQQLMTKEGRQIAENSGVFTNFAMQEGLLGRSMNRPDGQIFTAIRKLGNAGKWPFNMAEYTDQMTAFLGARLKGLSQGMTEEQAIKYAHEVRKNTAFTYGVLGTPRIMQSPVGRLAFQFGIFPIKRFEMFQLWAKRGEWDKLAKSMLASYALINGMRRALNINEDRLGELLPLKFGPVAQISYQAMGHIFFKTYSGAVSDDWSDVARTLTAYFPGVAFNRMKKSVEIARNDYRVLSGKGNLLRMSSFMEQLKENILGPSQTKTEELDLSAKIDSLMKSKGMTLYMRRDPNAPIIDRKFRSIPKILRDDNRYKEIEEQYNDFLALREKQQAEDQAMEQMAKEQLKLFSR